MVYGVLGALVIAACKKKRETLQHCPTGVVTERVTAPADGGVPNDMFSVL